MGREGEREGGTHQCVGDILIGCLWHAPNGGLVYNSGMCADGELNLLCFGVQANAQEMKLFQVVISIKPREVDK